jgi:hypothetical protein
MYYSFSFPNGLQTHAFYCSTVLRRPMVARGTLSVTGTLTTSVTLELGLSCIHTCFVIGGSRLTSLDRGAYPEGASKLSVTAPVTLGKPLFKGARRDGWE